MNHEREVLSASRRGLLALAGCVVAFPTTALAASVALPEAKSRAARVSESIDPFFIETAAKIDDCLTRWQDLDAECKMRDRALNAWEKRNPLPGYLLPGDHGYSPTARSDYHARHQNVWQGLGLAKIKSERNAAAAAYNQEVKAFAAMDAENLAELIFKVQTGVMMDSSDGIIARSVLFNIVQLRRDGDFRYQAAASRKAVV